MEFHGPQGDVEFASDLFVGELLEQCVQYFLLTAGDFGRRFDLQVEAKGSPQHQFHKARKHRTRHPEPSLGNQRQSMCQLLSRLVKRKQSPDPHVKERIGFGGFKFVGDNDDSRRGVLAKDIRDQVA